MAFVTHAQQVNIEAFRRKVTDLALIGLCCVLHGYGSQVIAVNVALRDIHVCQESLTGLALVRVRIAHRHVALIAKENMDARPVHRQCWVVAALLLCGVVKPRQLAQHTYSCSATGEHDAGDTILVEAAAWGLNRRNRLNKGECGGGYELVDVANAAKRDHGAERSF